MDRLTEMIEARGGRNQLIMFVTGLAGAGKSTGINVAQRFCYEFCKAASVMWRDNTFLFTAYTGSAAAAFGGLTTSSATFLGKRNLSDDDRQTFEGVRIRVTARTPGPPSLTNIHSRQPQVVRSRELSQNLNLFKGSFRLLCIKKFVRSNHLYYFLYYATFSLLFQKLLGCLVKTLIC